MVLVPIVCRLRLDLVESLNWKRQPVRRVDRNIERHRLVQSLSDGGLERLWIITASRDDKRESRQHNVGLAVVMQIPLARREVNRRFLFAHSRTFAGAEVLLFSASDDIRQQRTRLDAGGWW